MKIGSILDPKDTIITTKLKPYLLGFKTEQGYLDFIKSNKESSPRLKTMFYYSIS